MHAIWLVEKIEFLVTWFYFSNTRNTLNLNRKLPQWKSKPAQQYRFNISFQCYSSGGGVLQCKGIKMSCAVEEKWQMCTLSNWIFGIAWRANDLGGLPDPSTVDLLLIASSHQCKDGSIFLHINRLALMGPNWQLLFSIRVSWARLCFPHQWIQSNCCLLFLAIDVLCSKEFIFTDLLACLRSWLSKDLKLFGLGVFLCCCVPRDISVVRFMRCLVLGRPESESKISGGDWLCSHFALHFLKVAPKQ